MPTRLPGSPSPIVTFEELSYAVSTAMGRSQTLVHFSDHLGWAATQSDRTAPPSGDGSDRHRDRKAAHRPLGYSGANSNGPRMRSYRPGVVLTGSRLERDTRSYWGSGQPKVSSVGWEDCECLFAVLPTGQRVAIMERIEVRIEPATRGFTKSQPSGRGELRGWLALPGDEGFDASLPIGRSVDRPTEFCPSVSLRVFTVREPEGS